MTNEVNNHQDIIDSRDVIARIEELRDEEAALVEATEPEDSADLSPAASDELAEWREDYGAELKALESLAGAVAALPTEFRAALLLRVEEDLSFRQIAGILGVTEETARWRVFKARQKLLEQLGPNVGGDS